MFWPLCSNFEPYFELFHYLCIFRAEGLLLLSLSLCCSSPALFSPSLSVLSLSLGSLSSSSLFHLFLLPLSTFCILSLIPISVSLLLSLPNLPQALEGFYSPLHHRSLNPPPTPPPPPSALVIGGWWGYNSILAGWGNKDRSCYEWPATNCLIHGIIPLTGCSTNPRGDISIPTKQDSINIHHLLCHFLFTQPASALYSLLASFLSQMSLSHHSYVHNYYNRLCKQLTEFEQDHTIKSRVLAGSTEL